MRLEPADEYAPKGDDVLEALARVPDPILLHAGNAGRPVHHRHGRDG